MAEERGSTGHAVDHEGRGACHEDESVHLQGFGAGAVEDGAIQLNSTYFIDHSRSEAVDVQPSGHIFEVLPLSFDGRFKPLLCLSMFIHVYAEFNASYTISVTVLKGFHEVWVRVGEVPSVDTDHIGTGGALEGSRLERLVVHL